MAFFRFSEWVVLWYCLPLLKRLKAPKHSVLSRLIGDGGNPALTKEIKNPFQGLTKQPV